VISLLPCRDATDIQEHRGSAVENMTPLDQHQDVFAGRVIGPPGVSVSRCPLVPGKALLDRPADRPGLSTPFRLDVPSRAEVAGSSVHADAECFAQPSRVDGLIPGDRTPVIEELRLVTAGFAPV